MPKELVIYTDGACSGNPGKGGWGVFIFNTKTELYGRLDFTTNNQMELLAVINALLYTEKNNLTDHILYIYTDSQYVKNGITTWIKSWKNNNWKNSAKKPVKNKELWQQLDNLCQNKNITWNWVKGHNGDIGNEKADELARRGIEEL